MLPCGWVVASQPDFPTCISATFAHRRGNQTLPQSTRNAGSSSLPVRLYHPGNGTGLALLQPTKIPVHGYNVKFGPRDSSQWVRKRTRRYRKIARNHVAPRSVSTITPGDPAPKAWILFWRQVSSHSRVAVIPNRSLQRSRQAGGPRFRLPNPSSCSLPPRRLSFRTRVCHR